MRLDFLSLSCHGERVNIVPSAVKFDPRGFYRFLVHDLSQLVSDSPRQHMQVRSQGPVDDLPDAMAALVDPA
jgi:hypothetical protein